jgi:uncharacterized repeat protein (TIGR02543 family)
LIPERSASQKGKVSGALAERAASLFLSKRFPETLCAAAAALALTTFHGKPDCAKACIDIPPNRTMILHKIAELYTLGVSVSGSGQVLGSVGGINCPSSCSASLRKGTFVRLAAVPAQGWLFAGWRGACTGTDPSCVVTMDSAKTATATFVPTYVLTVSTGGSPGGGAPGEVGVNPPGIPCNTGPCAYRFNAGTTVVLTAHPSPWQVFAGWDGACTGTAPTCVVTMNASIEVRAFFSPRLTATPDFGSRFVG